jgi:hypothetical protein
MKPIEYTEPEWSRLLVAALVRVARARANAKRRKEQSMHDVVASDLGAVLDAADAEHARLVAAVEALRAEIARDYLPSLEARALLRDAWQARQREVEVDEPSQPCAMSLVATEQRVRLFDVHDGASEHTVDGPAWLKWTEAAMVVGSSVTWLDEQAAAWLDASPHTLDARTRQITRGTLAALVTDAHLQLKRRAFNAACRVLVHQLEIE